MAIAYSKNYEKIPGRASYEGLLSYLQDTMFKLQEEDGHWHFPLDDNITLTAEYILFLHWLDLQEPSLIHKLGKHLLKEQKDDGSWSVYFNGPGNLSATVEAYTALRMSGIPSEEPALKKACRYIHSQGGLARSRVFTKIWLALFELYPWKGVPIIPPELMFAPRKLPFHILEFSYWSRSVIIPLTILFHLQRARKVLFDVDELFLSPEDKHDPAFLLPQAVDDSWIVEANSWKFSWINWEQFFLALNKGVSIYENRSPVKPLRNLAIRMAKKWILDHQEESGDWGGIIPAMMNSVMALVALGMDLKDPPVKKGLEAIRRFCRGESKQIRRHLRESSDTAVLQSCVSPIWDTAIGALAMVDSGLKPENPRLQKAKDFLWSQRIEQIGDWAIKARLKKDEKFAAWCFQYDNSQFPDVDDSAMVTLALHRLGMSTAELSPAIHWLKSMQSSDGGWGAFDRDNNQRILNQIPFADLKSLIDPSSPDVTGHVLETFGNLGLASTVTVKRGIRYLKRCQKADGSWFGRWGVNYLYGTSAAIVGLRAVGEPADSIEIHKALAFILERQNEDGGWGESCESYENTIVHGRGKSTPSQTAWALLAIAACQKTHRDYEDRIHKAIQFLESRKTEDGLFEEEYTGTGFPVHFYLRYDGYRNYFPLMALGRLKFS